MTTLAQNLNGFTVRATVDLDIVCCPIDHDEPTSPDESPIVAAGNFVTEFEKADPTMTGCIDSIEVLEAVGPAGGNPVIRFGGTAQAVESLLGYYNSDETWEPMGQPS